MTQFFGNTVQGDFLYINLSNSQSGNTSTVSWELYWAFRSPTLDSQLDAGSLVINGQSVYSTTRAHNWSQRTVAWNLLLNSGSRTITHNSEGNLAIGVSGSVKLWNHSASSFSATYTLPRITRPPSQPGTPSASALGSFPEGRVSVSWGAPGDNGGLGIDGYNVFANGGLAQQIGNTTSTTLAYTPGTVVSFSVEARNGAGTSARSGTSNTVTTDGLPLATGAASNNLGAGVTQSGSTLVSWNTPFAVGGIRGYNVYANGVFWHQSFSSATSVVLSGLIPNTGYTFGVSARNAFAENNGTEGPRSNVFGTTSGPPGPPTGIVAQNSSDNASIPANTIDLSWTAPSFTSGRGITGYIISYTLAGNTIQATTGGATSIRLSGLSPGVPYSISISARNNLSGSGGIGAASTISKSAVALTGWSDVILLQEMRVGTPYNDSVSGLSAAGITYLYTVVNAPAGIQSPVPGITLVNTPGGSQTGTVSGVPTTQGKFSFSIRATPTLTSNGQVQAAIPDQTYTVYVRPAARRSQAAGTTPVQNIRRLTSGVWVEVGRQDVVSGSLRGANQPIGMYRWNGTSWVSTTIPLA